MSEQIFNLEIIKLYNEKEDKKVDISQMQGKLKDMLLEKRYLHSLNVMETAKDMAKYYHADAEKAEIAGLLHDCAKNYSTAEMFILCEKFGIELDSVAKKQPGLIHAFLGAEVAKREFQIDDEEIYDAIYYHTVGKPKMGVLTKIIYIADGIEPLRNYDGVDTLRELAYRDLDKAIIYQMDLTIKQVIKKGTLLHPGTVNTRNYYISR